MYKIMWTSIRQRVQLVRHAICELIIPMGRLTPLQSVNYWKSFHHFWRIKTSNENMALCVAVNFLHLCFSFGSKFWKRWLLIRMTRVRRVHPLTEFHHINDTINDNTHKNQSTFAPQIKTSNFSLVFFLKRERVKKNVHHILVVWFWRNFDEKRKADLINKWKNSPMWMSHTPSVRKVMCKYC